VQGDDCTNPVVEQYTYIEEQFALDNVDTICSIFNIDPATLDKRDFFYFLADIYTSYVQYGNRQTICDTLIAEKDEDILI